MYIINEVYTCTDYKILREEKEGNDWKVIFEAVLQTADEPNQNRRIYPADLLREAVEVQLKPKAKSRQLYGELDHPVRIGNTEADMARHSTVLLKEASHLITDIWMDGKIVRGIVETLKTPNGEILANLVRDKCPVGFSLRALGDVEQQGQYLRVKKPFLAITYDAVANPSHASAVVQKVLKENLYAVNLLNENVNTPSAKLLTITDMFMLHLQKRQKQLSEKINRILKRFQP